MNASAAGGRFGGVVAFQCGRTLPTAWNVWVIVTGARLCARGQCHASCVVSASCCCSRDQGGQVVAWYYHVPGFQHGKPCTGLLLLQAHKEWAPLTRQQKGAAVLHRQHYTHKSAACYDGVQQTQALANWTLGQSLCTRYRRPATAKTGTLRAPMKDL